MYWYLVSFTKIDMPQAIEIHPQKTYLVTYLVNSMPDVMASCIARASADLAMT